MIYTVRTTVGQETMLMDLVAAKSKKEGLEIYSIVVMPGLKGYVLIEGDHENTVQRAIAGLSLVKGRGVVAGKINIEELSAVFASKPLMESIKPDQKVELISGPFKGEKARVIRVNDTKEEVTVELLEATVKIPVTIKAEHIRVIKE
ncbi:MAG: transcription elongation factor Spt5 [Candidatus Diapherotrites archaeon]|nr:transcription elongation factor Spt5 [Candidatus Diapherotrites archaeon]